MQYYFCLATFFFVHSFQPEPSKILTASFILAVALTTSIPAITAHQADLDPISWEQFVREQLIRYKKEVADEKANDNDNSKSSNDAAGNEGTEATDNSKGNSTSGGGSNNNNTTEDDLEIWKNGDKVVMEYLCKPEPDPCPTLKHYEMYPLKPEDDFYPSWSYYGFRPPEEWHMVPIEFFQEPPLEDLDKEENHRLRRHGSAMHLCTDKVSNDTENCKRLVKNECINNMPSPINILSKRAVEDPKLGEIDFINYDSHFAFEMFFESDGSQLLFVKFMPHFNDGARPGIRGGPLGPDNELFLDRIIIRTGFDHKRGSEHSLDGKFFGMEIQFYFTVDGEIPYWQALSQYKTLPKNDGSIGHRMHVLSVFTEVPEAGTNPPDGSQYAGNPIETLSLAAEMFWKSANVNRSSTVRVSKHVLTLEEFFHEPVSGPYYSYQGSLTHPPCLTNVGWTVFEKPIWIQHHQWRRFAYTHVEYSDYGVLAGNTRPQTQILVKADIDMFRHMKIAEGYGRLRQTELDEAAENTRQPIIRGDSNILRIRGTSKVKAAVGNKTSADSQNKENITIPVKKNSDSDNTDILTTTVKANSDSNVVDAKGIVTTTEENYYYLTTTLAAYPHQDLYLIRKYAEYPKYFAQRVRKSTAGMARKRRLSEFDYYEDENHPGKTSATCSIHIPNLIVFIFHFLTYSLGK